MQMLSLPVQRVKTAALILTTYPHQRFTKGEKKTEFKQLCINFSFQCNEAGHIMYTQVIGLHSNVLTPA